MIIMAASLPLFIQQLREEDAANHKPILGGFEPKYKYLEKGEIN